MVYFICVLGGSFMCMWFFIKMYHAVYFLSALAGLLFLSILSFVARAFVGREEVQGSAIAVKYLPVSVAALWTPWACRHCCRACSGFGVLDLRLQDLFIFNGITSQRF